MALAATGDVQNAFNAGRMTAQMLKSYGINFNYAPVADVNSEPKNPVIGVRSPSDDPELVARVVGAQIRGLRDGNVVGCVKHFPGHGDTAIDSHLGTPVIEKTREEMENCELIPFKRAISEGVDAIMTAHISTPRLFGAALDPGHKLSSIPASLNPDAIAILREDFGFDGLIVSDCLEMDGVRAKFGTATSAVYALQVCEHSEYSTFFKGSRPEQIVL
jgi:beta-N-acetylhexosaminidase